MICMLRFHIHLILTLALTLLFLLRWWKEREKRKATFTKEEEGGVPEACRQRGETRDVGLAWIPGLYFFGP